MPDSLPRDAVTIVITRDLGTVIGTGTAVTTVTVTAKAIVADSSELQHRGVKAAIDAAAVEAFRLRNEPGSWTAGAKAERIATAAISAGVIGAAAADKTAGGHDKSKLGTIGSAIGGLVVNRVVNGPRRDVR
ncbi:hypothetical protein QBC46DRAFT_438019 [Diplogelasinospora grovesii]|uniref:Uncharacterized protein n=1 Tax=Diplogelasinospora grovesii TaxID=303347 RepID=A0AAN6N5C0_9PEZI|nr:hypothetical protein QBC46DRAFT_438019 [Diplogelasinospora grovesii]